VHILPVALSFKSNGVFPTVSLSYLDIGPLVEASVDDLEMLVVNRGLNKKWTWLGLLTPATKALNPG
jgi:hypothetical protein